MSSQNDFNNENSNTSNNPSFDSVLQARLSRRGMLLGSVASVSTAVLGGTALTACGGGGTAAATATTPAVSISSLGFGAVAKSLADKVTVPAGYTANVIYALGDPILNGATAFKNDGSDADFENRAGDHHDGMEWYGLSATGRPSLTSTDRGLLAMNHEATTDERSSFFIHTNGGTATLPRPAAEVDKEVAIHGISVVEVKKTGESWGYVKDSAFNFRLTPLTDVEMAGPVRGNKLMQTRYSPSGTRTRGTLNNCGTGKTPWGSFLTGEENWVGYFFRNATDNTARGNDKSVTSLNRYGRAQGGASRHGWETAGSADKYLRWDISKLGTSTDGSDDYRNELNGLGYIVEIDPYDKSRTAKKRSALGRFAHESAAFSVPTNALGSTDVPSR
ncbi:MAG: alkaline phosphatase PhoX, partial [Pseudomonadota bacterium]